MEYSPNPQLNEYYRQEAALMYQQAQMAGAASMPLPRYADTYTFWKAAKEVVGGPSVSGPGSYRLAADRHGAAAQGLVERTAQTLGTAANVIGSALATDAMTWPLLTKVGIVGGIGIPMLAGYAFDKVVGGYLGFDQAVSQLSRISDLQLASQEFMGGIYSKDPYGKRMSRSQAKQANDFLEDYARTISAYSRMNVSSDDLRNEVAMFSENKLLENVRSADDFAKKFSNLRKTVYKVAETLGKSLEETTSALGQMRQNLNISPFESLDLLTSVRRLGTQAGLDFDTTFNSSMEGAMLGRNYRIGAQGGMMIGARAAADASMLYQSGAISDEMLFRLGGEEGTRQRLMRNMMAASQTALVDLSLVSAFSGGEGFNRDSFLGFIAGDQTVLKNFQAPRNLEDLMAFQTQRGKIVSEISEENPLLLQAAAFTQLWRLADDTKIDFRDMDTRLQTMAQLSGGAFNRDDLRLILEQIKGWREGQERSQREERMIGIGRTQDQTSRLFGTVGEDIRASRAYRDIVNLGLRATDTVRDTAFNVVEGTVGWLREQTTGVYRSRLSSEGVAIRDEDGERIRFQSGYYRQSDLQAVSGAATGALALNRLRDEMDLPASQVQMMEREGDFDRSTSTWSAQSKDWWRRRVAEINSSLPEGERLAENALDQFAGRAVTVQEVAAATGLTFFEKSGTFGRYGETGWDAIPGVAIWDVVSSTHPLFDAVGLNRFDRDDRVTYVTRSGIVDQTMSNIDRNANVIRAARALNPEDIKATGRENEAIAKMFNLMDTQIGPDELADINEREFTAGPRMAAQVLRALNAAAPDLTDTERERVLASFISTATATRPEWSTAIANMDQSYELGQDPTDVKTAEKTLEQGRKAFLESYLNDDPLLRATRGKSYNDLSLADKQRLKDRKTEIENRNRQFKRLKDDLDDGGYMNILTSYQAHLDNMQRRGMSEEESYEAVMANDSAFWTKLTSNGIGIGRAFSLVEGMGELDSNYIYRANDYEVPWWKKGPFADPRVVVSRESFLSRNQDAVDRLYAEYRASGLSVNDYWNSLKGESQSIMQTLAKNAQQELGMDRTGLMNLVTKLMYDRNQLTPGGQLQAAARNQAQQQNPGQVETQTNSDTEKTILDTDTTMTKLMESTLQGLVGDIKVTNESQRRVNSELLQYLQRAPR